MINDNETASPIESQLQNFGYFTEDGSPLLEAPPNGYLLKIAGMQRASYFPHQKQGAVIKTIDLGGGKKIEKYGPPIIPYKTKEKEVIPNSALADIRKSSSLGAGEILNTFTIKQLADTIEQDFSGKSIAIRGTACSLNGEIIQVKSGKRDQ